jgi:hypothetical protein
MTKYKLIEENQWEKPIRKNYKLACCDCGLVHNVDFKIEKKAIMLRMRRNNRATAAIRRGMKNKGL